MLTTITKNLRAATTKNGNTSKTSILQSKKPIIPQDWAVLNELLVNQASGSFIRIMKPLICRMQTRHIQVDG